MSEEIANHSEQSQETPQQAERDAETDSLFEQFGIQQPKKETKDIEFPNMDEPQDPPTTEEEEGEDQKPSGAKLKIKYNGEEREVDEEEARTLAQKGMNYDKLQQKLDSLQQKIDQQEQEKEKELEKQREQAFNDLQEDMIAQLEENGISREAAEKWIEDHPAIKEAKAAREQQLQQTQSQQVTQKWQTLYDKYPHLLEEAQGFMKGETPSFFTDDMRTMVEKGYEPIHAFELAHKDTLSTQAKKAAEQKLIKQQQLGIRSHVNEQTATPPDEASLTPAQRSLAEEFGVDLKGVQKQQQLLKSRR